MPNKVHERVWDSFRLLEPGVTPLHYVLLRSCPLLKGAQPKSLYPGPPNLAIMRELLERGAAPNLATQRSGRTPLMLAAAFGFEVATIRSLDDLAATEHLLRDPQGPVFLDCKINADIAAPFMGEFAAFEQRSQ